MRLRLLVLRILGSTILGVPLEPAAADAVSEEAGLTGDWGGVRQQWKDAGVKLGAIDISEVLSDPVGGIRQLTVYHGRLTLSLDLDLDKLVGWRGARFYANAYQISGRSGPGTSIGNLLTVSSIAALSSTRLYDLWLQQEFPDRKGSLRAGQIAADDDDEFFISQYSASFINATFGWPDVMSVNLPSGGPAYPLATPGVRARAAPTSGLTFSAAVFNGDPAPPGAGDPQVRNSSGTNFLVGEGGWFLLAEAAYAFDKASDPTDPLSDVKLGGWYHTGVFADQRRDALGRSLADPESSGIARTRRGDFGLYIVVDKMLWQPSDKAAGALAGFLRIGGAPADRNLVSLEVDAGLTYKGPFPRREQDLLGVAASYVRIGSSARGLNRDAILLTSIERPIRDYETVLEVTYQAHVAPRWIFQPDLQFIFHPGGHSARPAAEPTASPIPNALVVGLRTSINF